ncbi:hypothetical protein PR048_021818 [Dryococelus australis]|uniref:Uncharacterized protein n=1 Tax=Dryococelus australis TaxID=614101 RepID=A0ABQ9GZB9_9NEOP|nr:hypothetical protein PR048_021818 [Dryococelus australis]
MPQQAANLLSRLQPIHLPADRHFQLCPVINGNDSQCLRSLYDKMSQKQKLVNFAKQSECESREKINKKLSVGDIATKSDVGKMQIADDILKSKDEILK